MPEKNSPNLSWELLHSADDNQKGLQEKLKQALKEQYPEEYRQRFPEEFSGEQGQIAPANRILWDAVDLPKPKQVIWQNRERHNEGFTILHAMLFVTILVLMIPAAMLVFIVKAIEPGMMLMLIGMLLAYVLGRSVQKQKQ